MIENTPIFTSDKNENKINNKNKNNVDEYIKTRVEIKKNIWKIFRGIVNMKDLTIPDALTEAIILWIEDIETVQHVCCICNNIVDENYFRKIINGDVVYYCSDNCVNKEYLKKCNVLKSM